MKLNQDCLSQEYLVSICPVNFFRSSEETDGTGVQKVMQSILETKKWIFPITAEAETGIVMDGNHRLQAAKLLGLRYLPAILLRYDDPRVKVYFWGDNSHFDMSLIFEAVKKNVLLPQKTTRHVFTPTIQASEIPLGLLLREGN